MSVIHILDLPDEILGQVFSWLSVEMLCNVSVVCKSFCSFSQPLIFRSINLALSPPPKSNHPGEHYNRDTTYQFWDIVTTLTEHSRLRESVKSLSLDVWHHPWYEHFRDQNRLVELLPSLKCLYLKPPPAKLDLSGHLSMKSLNLDFGDFEGDVSGPIDEGQRETSLQFLISHLWYPSLRKVKASWSDLLTPVGHGICFLPEDPTRMSSVNHLILNVYDEENVGALSELLRCFRTLEFFTFETDCSWEGAHMTAHGISPQSISLSLSPHTSTLVELVIACSDAASFAETPLFGSLTHFTSLKRLGIPETFLVNGEDKQLDHLLPSTLEFLQLQYPMGLNQGHDDLRSIRVERMKSLAYNKHPKLPFLTCLVWWDQQAGCWIGTTYGPASDLIELGHIHREVGVKFHYRNASEYDDTPLAGRMDSHGVERDYLGTDLLPVETCSYAPRYDDGTWLAKQREI